MVAVAVASGRGQVGPGRGATQEMYVDLGVDEV